MAFGLRRKDRLRIPKQVIVISLLAASLAFAGPTLAEHAVPSVERLRYQANISFINAGQVEMERYFYPDRYELVGDVTTSAVLKPFLTWSGHFAALGRQSANGIESLGYFLDSIGRKDRRAVTLVHSDLMVRYRAKHGWRDGVAPIGTDMMSVLFASTRCFDGDSVHDGEDSYPIRLRNQQTDRLRLGTGYYSGSSTRCDYQGEDLKGRRRDVTVWIARLPAYPNPVAVKVEVDIPRAPAAVLLLQVPARNDAPAQDAAPAPEAAAAQDA